MGQDYTAWGSAEQGWEGCESFCQVCARAGRADSCQDESVEDNVEAGLKEKAIQL